MKQLLSEIKYRIKKKLYINSLLLKKYRKSFLRKPLRNKLFLHIPDSKLARYLYIYTHFFQNVFSVYLYPSFKMLNNLTDYSKWILDEHNIRFQRKLIEANTGIIVYNGKEIKFTVSYDYFTEISSTCWTNKFVMPYTMHPGQYKWNYLNKTELNIELPRPLHVMFLGGVNSENYHNPVIEEKFELLSRWEVVSFLEKNIEFIEPENDAQIHDYIKKGEQKLIIYNTYKTVLWQKEWLSTLSKLNFYIALPGVSMPLCHNLIEAISVGAIPILQYNKFIYPALEHRKNCLVFNTLEELVLLLDEIRNMQEEEIAKLRHNVYQYYQKFHSEKGFSKNILKFLDDIEEDELFELVLNAEMLSTKLYHNE